MGDDEAATVKTIELYSKIISDLINQHRGRTDDSLAITFCKCSTV
jgi:hypothetical protein